MTLMKWPVLASVMPRLQASRNRLSKDCFRPHVGTRMKPEREIFRTRSLANIVPTSRLYPLMARNGHICTSRKPHSATLYRRRNVHELL